MLSTIQDSKKKKYIFMFFFPILVLLCVSDFNNDTKKVFNRVQNYIMFEEETAQFQNWISEFNNLHRKI